MNKDRSISEREFELINIIADGMALNQRALSVKAGISLGMTNLLLKRLVIKGYLRVRQLNPKKVEYLLTRNGFSEKAKKSYRYTLKTMNSLAALKEKIRDILSSEHAQGISEVILLGKGDWQDMVDLASRSFSPGSLQLSITDNLESIPANSKAVILYAEEQKEYAHPSIRTINLVQALSQPMPPRHVPKQTILTGQS